MILAKAPWSSVAMNTRHCLYRPAATTDGESVTARRLDVRAVAVRHARPFKKARPA
jgi:hypothetical protein